MLHLTKGIQLTVNTVGGKVTPGGARLWWEASVRLWVTLEGQAGEGTGFLVNVAEIKAALRRDLEEREVTAKEPGDLFRWARKVVREKFGEFKLIRLKLDMSEQMSVAGGVEDDDMVEITKKYELAAAHKLWNDEWDQKRNFEVFGKCSNPRGHGHNYTLEVTIQGKPDSRTGLIASQQEIDKIVEGRIIERFDHKNLNEDTAEFAELVPTVENMAKVFFELLEGEFETGRLVRVAVWETPSTYAEYFGPQAGPLRFSDSV
jgi:6-pyruvoyltetrahydropterin/6-carboxytetrahydropterin synthase